MSTTGDAARAADGTTTTRRSDDHPACDLYVPGHLVHPTQARKAWESGGTVRWGRFERVDEGCLVVRFLDGTGRYRVHRAAEVARVAEAGDKVRVSERWRVASISRRFEQLLAVCIALPNDTWWPCSVAPEEPASLDDVAQRLADRGGFFVSGPVVAQLARRAREGDDDRPPGGGLHGVS